jgi:hypothetical protein
VPVLGVVPGEEALAEGLGVLVRPDVDLPPEGV